MKMFLSKYLNNVDKKGRVSVPSDYRAILPNREEDIVSIIVYPSIKNKCIEACSIERLEQLSNIIQNLDPYSEERDAFESIILGESRELNLDKEGRIIIPKNLIEYAELEDQVCFIGKGLVFEMWNPINADGHLSKSRTIAQNNRNLLKNI